MSYKFVAELKTKCSLGRCTDEHWNILAKNITPVLVYYNECNNHEYYISADEANTLEKHFGDQVLRYLRPNTSYNKNIFPNMHLNFIYNAKECYISEVPLNLVTAHIKAFQFIINQTTHNISQDIAGTASFRWSKKSLSSLTGRLCVSSN